MPQLHEKQNTEIISKLFQSFISHVTTSETELISAAEIISKLFQRHWTCWKIFISCNTLLKYGNFEIISGKFPCAEIKLFQSDVDEGWNNFETILFHMWPRHNLSDQTLILQRTWSQQSFSRTLTDQPPLSVLWFSWGSFTWLNTTYFIQ